MICKDSQPALYDVSKRKAKGQATVSAQVTLINTCIAYRYTLSLLKVLDSILKLAFLFCKDLFKKKKKLNITNPPESWNERDSIFNFI